MFRRLVWVLLAIPVVLIVLHTIVRIVRHFYKFPMPEFMADLIDQSTAAQIPATVRDGCATWPGAGDDGARGRPWQWDVHHGRCAASWSAGQACDCRY